MRRCSSAVVAGAGLKGEGGGVNGWVDGWMGKSCLGFAWGEDRWDAGDGGGVFRESRGDVVSFIDFVCHLSF